MKQLFVPVVDSCDQHPNFAAIANSHLFGPEQQVISNWAETFVDRDNKFIKEFQSTFNSSFWELYLHAAFEELGFSTDYTHPTPDFLLSHESGSLVAEAVTAAHPDGHRPEWDHPDIRDATKLNREELLSLASVRLANAIRSKESKYQEKYSKLPHVASKPFLICLAPFEQPFFFMQNDNAVRRVLYGFDRLIAEDDYERNTRTIHGQTRTNSVLKTNGSLVPLGLFTRPGLAHVSAIIFSNTATLTKVRALAGEGNYPVVLTGCRYNAKELRYRVDQSLRLDYKETLLDGLHVCLNPFATHPLPIEAFEGREIAIHRFDTESQIYDVDAPDNFLFQHASMAFVTSEHGKSLDGKTTNTGNVYPQYKLPPFPPGELIPFEGELGIYTDHHLSHHRGWTILLAYDTEDGDWGAQAIKSYAYSISDFRDRNPDAEWIMPSNWHPTKEQAYEECRIKVDQRADPASHLKRAVRYVLFDSNYWKSFVYARLAVAMGDKGCLSLFGRDAERHRLFAEHLTAEYRIKTEGRGRTVDEWKLRSERSDNHWLDCVVGSAVGASMQGTVLFGTEAVVGKAGKRVSFKELQRRRRR